MTLRTSPSPLATVCALTLPSRSVRTQVLHSSPPFPYSAAVQGHSTFKSQSSCRGLKFFPKNSSKSIEFSPKDYNLGRSEDIFVKFLNQQCGTHRSPGGGALTDLAGRVLGLDELVGGWFLNPVQHSSEEAVGVVEQAKKVVGGLSGNAILATSGQYYLKVVNRLVEKKDDGKAWVTKEQARFVHLSSFLLPSSLASVLRSFRPIG
jgi:hypothetical protein